MLTALRATSSTATVISLTAVAACSTSLLCWCRVWLECSVTACSSSAAEASWLDESAIRCRVPRRLACMVCRACSRRAGSSLPLTAMLWPRSPRAMVSATSTAWPRGRTMLRVRNRARTTVRATTTSMISRTMPTAPLNTWLLCAAAAIPPRVLTSMMVSNSLSMASALARNGPPSTMSIAASLWPWRIRSVIRCWSLRYSASASTKRS